MHILSDAPPKLLCLHFQSCFHFYKCLNKRPFFQNHKVETEFPSVHTVDSDFPPAIQNSAIEKDNHKTRFSNGFLNFKSTTSWPMLSAIQLCEVGEGRVHIVLIILVVYSLFYNSYCWLQVYIFGLPVFRFYFTGILCFIFEFNTSINFDWGRCLMSIIHFCFH